MFKGKVIIYENIDWEERKIVKEFNNYEDYVNFLKKLRNKQNRLRFYEDFEIEDVLKKLWIWISKFIDSLQEWVKDRIEYFKEDVKELPVEIDLNKYEEAIKRFKKEKEERERKKENLKNALKKLLDYRKQLEELWKEDLLQQIDEDIAKVENELKKIK